MECKDCELHKLKSEYLYTELMIVCPEKFADYVMSYVDWSEVKVDTLVLVREREEDDYRMRYFAKYENGKVFTFANGRTSLTNNDKTNIQKELICWKYAKLANI